MESYFEVVPDEPQYVEARSLLRGNCLIIGDRRGGVILAPDGKLLCLFGDPPDSAIRQAMGRRAARSELLGWKEHVPRLNRILEREGMRAVIHTHESANPPELSPTVPARVDILTKQDEGRLTHVPDELRQELSDALAKGPVAVSVADGSPVSFCYAGAITETYWDVSVDTLPGHRRLGLAALAFSKMAARMSVRGLRPVWGALETNEPSMALARKLGFESAGALYLWTL